MNLFTNNTTTAVDFSFSKCGVIRFLHPNYSGEGSSEKFLPKVSAKAGRVENEETLAFFKSLVVCEDSPVVFQDNWGKFLDEQQDYFDRLHPSNYVKNCTLRGWEKRAILYQIGEESQKMYVLCPQKMKFAEWRTYDGMKTIHGKLLDTIIDANGETTFVVSPSDTLLMVQDYNEHRQGQTVCPFVKANLIALNSHDYGWFWAGIQPPVIEDFLD